MTDTRRCPAVCKTCGKPYRYATTLTSAIRICDCDDPPTALIGGEEEVVVDTAASEPRQLEMEV